MVRVLERYAQQLQADGRLLITVRVGEHVLEQLRKTETAETFSEEDFFTATDALGAAIRAALAAAARRLAMQGGDRA